MLENVMNKMGGIAAFGIISICIFFAFFAGMLIWAARLKKSYLNSMRGLPLEGESAPQTDVTSTSEDHHE